eukprot:5000777-Alexandrium_andersonii.AAC.1
MIRNPPWPPELRSTTTCPGKAMPSGRTRWPPATGPRTDTGGTDARAYEKRCPGEAQQGPEFPRCSAREKRAPT